MKWSLTPTTAQLDQHELGKSTQALSWNARDYKEKLEIVKNVRPAIQRIFDKLRDCYETSNTLWIDSAASLMYENQDDHTLYLRCWAHMKIEIPKDAVEKLLQWQGWWIDQFIDGWNVAFNSVDIPSPLWKNNPHLEVGDIVKWVPPQAQEVLDTPNPGRLKKWLRSMRKKLLPARINPWVSDEETSQWVPKIRQIGLIKHPLLIIRKRNS